MKATSIEKGAPLTHFARLRAVLRGRAAAFTLLEVLLALSLSGTVFAICSVVTVQTAQMEQRVRGELRDRWQRVRVLDAFEQDVRSMITWHPAVESGPLFPTDGGQGMEIIALSDAAGSAGPMRCRLPARVRYRIDPDPAQQGLSMMTREVVDLTSSAGQVRQRVVARGLARATLESVEQDLAPISIDRAQLHNSQEQPAYIRLVCAWADDRGREYRRTVPIARGRQ